MTNGSRAKAPRFAAARRIFLGLAGSLLVCAGAHAEEEAAAAQSPPLHFGIVYQADLMGVVSGGVSRTSGYIDQIVGTADADLDRLVGLKGVTAHLELMRSLTTPVSPRAGSELGVDGLEADNDRFRVQQAWVQKSFAGGKASVLVGFYDVGGDFDVTPSSELLISTSFGTSSEFDASGLAGPSAAPSTSLSARLSLQPTETTYAQLVVANARAAAPGDVGGADFSYRDGVLVAAEAGFTGKGKLAAGVWRYSKRLPTFGTELGEGDTHAAQGAYLLVDQPIGKPGGARSTSLFLKAGVADGRTDAFRGSWQAGVLVQQVFASRPDSQFSAGVSQGVFSDGFHDRQQLDDPRAGRTETAFEVTYSDSLGKHLKIQPDLQLIHRPSGRSDVNDALVVGVRATVSF